MLENTCHVEEIRDENMEFVNANSNLSEKHNQNLLELIDEITQTSNTNESPAYDENNSDSKFMRCNTCMDV